MLGNLDQPPLLVRRSRAKALAMVAGGLVAIGGGVIGLTDPGERHSMWPAGALLFGAALLFYLTEVIWPDRLVLSPVGLRFEGIWKNWSYRWEEVHDFGVIVLDRGVRAITYKIRRPHNAILSSISRDLMQTSGTLNGLWELGPDRLVALLNEAQSRWAGNAHGDGG